MSVTQSKNKSNAELKVYLKSFVRGKSIKSEHISYQRFLQDKLLVAHAVKRGVPAILFKEIKFNSPFDDQQWSNFLHINIRTLQRYKGEKSHIFKPIQSERIFELAEVISNGYEVFDNAEDFDLWLNSPSPALGNQKPIELLDTSYGKDLVLAELTRIEHGIFV